MSAQPSLDTISGLIEAVNVPGPSIAAHGLLFGDGDPNHPDAKYSYRTTFGDAIEVSAPGGVLHTNHARGTIVLVVSTWEHEYRKRIADEAGLESTEPPAERSVRGPKPDAPSHRAHRRQIG